MKYLLVVDGNVIIDVAMTLEEIIDAFGPIKKLERGGFKLVPVGVSK